MNIKKKEASLKAVSYSWDSLYAQELKMIKDRKSKTEFLKMMDETASKAPSSRSITDS